MLCALVVCARDVCACAQEQYRFCYLSLREQIAAHQASQAALLAQPKSEKTSSSSSSSSHKRSSLSHSGKRVDSKHRSHGDKHRSSKVMWCDHSDDARLMCGCDRTRILGTTASRKAKIIANET
jgi:hypothetical protein